MALPLILVVDDDVSIRTIVSAMLQPAGYEPVLAASAEEAMTQLKDGLTPRLILSDIVIYHAVKVERGIRDDNFFEVLKAEIEEGRQYYESRMPQGLTGDGRIFNETLEQFVQMKREESLGK